MRVKTLRQTCEYFPSQWEGLVVDGPWTRTLYAKYRWGHLEVCVSVSPSVCMDDAIGGVPIYSQEIGETGFEGIMSTGLLQHLTENVLDWSDYVQEETATEHHTRG